MSGNPQRHARRGFHSGSGARTGAAAAHSASASANNYNNSGSARRRETEGKLIHGSSSSAAVGAASPSERAAHRFGAQAQHRHPHPPPPPPPSSHAGETALAASPPPATSLSSPSSNQSPQPPQPPLKTASTTGATPMTAAAPHKSSASRRNSVPSPSATHRPPFSSAGPTPPPPPPHPPPSHQAPPAYEGVASGFAVGANAVGGRAADRDTALRVEEPSHPPPQQARQQQQMDPSPLPPPRGVLARPVIALSAAVMEVYQGINNKFYHEKRSQGMLGGVQTYNNGFDDADGHYIHIIGEKIADRYTVKGVLGKGSFGTVMHCCDEKYQEDVAMKVIRSGAYFDAQGRLEMEIVLYLNQLDELQNLVMQLRKAFYWQGHIVLVFELLSHNLFELIKCTHYNGVSLELTRKFTYQLLQVLVQLDKHRPRIIHSDLKPENVVLKDRKRSGIRIIDFGSSCYQQIAEWEMPAPLIPLGTRRARRGAAVGSHQAETHGRRVETGSSRRLSHDRHGRATLESGPLGSCAKHVDASAGCCAAAEPRGHGDATATSSSSEAAGTLSGRGKADVTHPPQTSSHAAAPASSSCGQQVSTYQHPSYNVMPKYIQSRFYRSPEVILELGYTTAIDRWSLGCTMVELHTGVPLFPGLNEVEMIGYFTSILGPLPDEMIAASPKFHLFYIDTRVEQGHEHTAAASAGGGGVFNEDDWVDLPLGNVTDGPGVGGSPQPARHRAATALLSTAGGGAAAAVVSGTAAAAASATPPLFSPQAEATDSANGYKVDAHLARRASTANPVTTSNPSKLGKAIRHSAGTHHAGTALAGPPSVEADASALSSGDASYRDAPPSPTRGDGVAASSTLLSPAHEDAATQQPPPPPSAASPFVLRHPPKPEWQRSLADILGVYMGGPRGCRKNQPGHDVKAYLTFLELVQGLLAYDPRKRIGCEDALNHPFLAPLREMERRAAAQAAAAAAAASTTTAATQLTTHDTPQQPQ